VVSRVTWCPAKSSSKKVAVKLLILQGGEEPLSSDPVWAELSQSLFGNWTGTEPPAAFSRCRAFLGSLFRYGSTSFSDHLPQPVVRRVRIHAPVPYHQVLEGAQLWRGLQDPQSRIAF
jgi:hypothetical protein